MSLYSRRGVSAQKEEKCIRQQPVSKPKGFTPLLFCKVYEDYLGKDADWVNIMHADGLLAPKHPLPISTGRRQAKFPFGKISQGMQ